MISHGCSILGPVEQGDPQPEDHLEHHQLGGHGCGLAQEQPGRIEPGEAQGVPGPVDRLDRDAPLDGQHGAEQDRHPEQAGGALGHQGAVGAEGEGEQARGPRSRTVPPGTGPPGNAPRCAGPCRPPGRCHATWATCPPGGRAPGRTTAGAGSERAGQDRCAHRPLGAALPDGPATPSPTVPAEVSPAGPMTRSAVTRPPVTTTARVARDSTKSASWEAITTVVPAAVASVISWLRSPGPMRRARRGARRAATARASGPPGRPGPPAGAARPRASRHSS